MEARYKTFPRIEYQHCNSIQEIRDIMQVYSPHNIVVNSGDCKVDDDFNLIYKNGSVGTIPFSREGFLRLLKFLKIPPIYIRKVTSETLALKNLNDRLFATSAECCISKSNVGEYMTDIFSISNSDKFKLGDYLNFLENAKSISPQSIKRTSVTENSTDVRVLFDVPGISNIPKRGQPHLYGYKTEWDWLSNKKPKMWLASYATECENSMIFGMRLDLSMKSLGELEESMLLNLQHVNKIHEKQSISVEKHPTIERAVEIYNNVKNILKNEDITSLVLKMPIPSYEKMKDDIKQIKKEFTKDGKIILMGKPNYPSYDKSYYDIMYDMTYGAHEYVSTPSSRHKLEILSGKIMMSLN